MHRSEPAIAPAAREQSRSSAASAHELREAPPWARRDADRAALRTQLAAFEGYYGLATEDLLACRARNTLPDRITRSEAARWAELHATLERMAPPAAQEQLPDEESDDAPVRIPARLRAA